MGQKKTMCLKPFWDFASQKCWPNKIFGPKNFQVRKYVGLIKCWVEKNFEYKKFRAKRIWIKTNFGSNRIFGPQKF